VSPLKELTQLTHLNISNNQINETDLQELREAHPNCTVFWFPQKLK